MHIKRFEVNQVCENTYLLYDETHEAALIDCGTSNEAENAQIQSFIDSNGLKLKYLLNTHLHFDHALGNHFIYKTYGIKPQYHAAEENMPGIAKQAIFFGIPVHYEPVRAEYFLKENDEIHFGNTVLKVLHTPGHSPGSLSYYCAADACVFTGDALFRHDIGRTDLWGGDEATLITAIKTRLLTLPPQTKIFAGHGAASTVAEEIELNPYIR
ncbi:MAG: MBL fold metallo-hydrolase [Dysgonamonadaceae bacterium]|jgi:glyoxylase-like metal-dependent hydrolase (beta-lactamase superfamily II)|nr:MBL fold metallo-hydrolase [Dysgonamonadaceae bacterium]